MKNFRYLVIGLILTIVFLGFGFFPVQKIDEPDDPMLSAKNKVSLAAFEKVLKVVKSPRCMNCHPSDDFPRQGNDSRIHLMEVQRGADGHGLPVMQCQTCHQSENNLNNVPGAPHWHLAPKSMGWMGLSDAEIGQHILDTTRNGGRSPEEIMNHMKSDPLVLWAWKPGGDRTPPPVPFDEFTKAVKLWIENGAQIPKNK